MFPENKTGKCCFHHPPSRNSTQKYYLQRDCVTFLFFNLYLYPLSCNIIYVCFFLFPLCVPSDLKIGYEKSILTRTETLSLTTCFKEPLLFITLFLKRTCFYLLFICYLLLLEHETRARCHFCIVTPKSCVRNNKLRNQKQLRSRNSRNKPVFEL